MYAVILLVLSVNLGVFGQLLTPAICPTAKPVKNFDLEKFLGRWYEYEKYFSPVEITGRCVSITYSRRDERSINVVNRQISTIAQLPFSLSGYATLQGDEHDGKMVIQTSVIPSLPPYIANLLQVPLMNVRPGLPYWILGTDYENYAVVWSCVHALCFNAQFAWVLTRARNPSSEVVKNAHKIFTANRLNTAALFLTNQTGCLED